MIDVCCAIIIADSNKILVTQRSELMSQPLKWEFPWGKVQGMETYEEALIREIIEELNISIEVIKPLPVTIYHYPKISINLIPFICKWVSGELLLKEHKDLKWLYKSELIDLDWAEADLPIVNYLLNQ